jgi:hypothetical protein
MVSAIASITKHESPKRRSLTLSNAPVSRITSVYASYCQPRTHPSILPIALIFGIISNSRNERRFGRADFVHGAP